MAMAAVLKKVAQKLAPADWRLPDSSLMLRELKDRARAANLVLEVRDARLPLTSANRELYEQICHWKQHMIVLNKVDLSDPERLNDWKSYFEERKQNHVFVDGHNKESVKRMVKEMKVFLTETVKSERTTLVILAGLANVGKSVISNTLHRVGRYNVSALEKLTLAMVGPEPYSTKHITGYKINYYPPMYVLDTPGLAHTSIGDVEAGLKLALTGAISDDVVGVERLVQYLLALWNSRPSTLHGKWIEDHQAHEFAKKPKDKYSAAEKREMGTDDYKFEVRGILASSLLHFAGNLQDETDMDRLIQSQLMELQSFFQTTTAKPIGSRKTAEKILNLYRVGKLGSFIWDALPARIEGSGLKLQPLAQPQPAETAIEKTKNCRKEKLSAQAAVQTTKNRRKKKLSVQATVQTRKNRRKERLSILAALHATKNRRRKS